MKILGSVVELTKLLFFPTSTGGFLFLFEETKNYPRLIPSSLSQKRRNDIVGKVLRGVMLNMHFS